MTDSAQPPLRRIARWKYDTGFRLISYWKRLLGRSFRGTNASGVTASAGARGLDKASEDYASRSGITQQHRDAVDRMTAYKIPDEEIQAFLKSGRLGEYAE